MGEPPGRGRGPDGTASAAAAERRRRERRARPDGDASCLVRWPGDRVRRVRSRAAPSRRSRVGAGDRGRVRRDDRGVPRPARRGRPVRQHGPDRGGRGGAGARRCRGQCGARGGSGRLRCPARRAGSDHSPDRPGDAGLGRGGGRGGHRADRPLTDDPGGAGLPGRYPRPALPEAHGALVLVPRAADRAGLPPRDHAARRRLLPQRRLRVGGRDRPPPGPLRDGAGLRPGRGTASSRSSRRSATTTTSGAPSPARCRPTRRARTRKG